MLIKKFADDTKGAKIIQKQEDNHKLQEALDCLCEWADKWGMSFNYGKCKIMHIGKNNPRHEYFMRGNKLTHTEEERDVRVIFTSNLKPSAQCSKAAGCATSVLNQLKRNFHFRTGIFLSIYTSNMSAHTLSFRPKHGPMADRGHRSDREGTGEGRQDGDRTERDHLQGKVHRAGAGNPENQTGTTGHGTGTQVCDE